MIRSVSLFVNELSGNLFDYVLSEVFIYENTLKLCVLYMPCPTC